MKLGEVSRRLVSLLGAKDADTLLGATFGPSGEVQEVVVRDAEALARVRGVLEDGGPYQPLVSLASERVRPSHALCDPPPSDPQHCQTLPLAILDPKTCAAVERTLEMPEAVGGQVMGRRTNIFAEDTIAVQTRLFRELGPVDRPLGGPSSAGPRAWEESFSPWNKAFSWSTQENLAGIFSDFPEISGASMEGGKVVALEVRETDKQGLRMLRQLLRATVGSSDATVQNTGEPIAMPTPLGNHGLLFALINLSKMDGVKVQVAGNHATVRIPPDAPMYEQARAAVGEIAHREPTIRIELNPAEENVAKLTQGGRTNLNRVDSTLALLEELVGPVATQNTIAAPPLAEQESTLKDRQLQVTLENLDKTIAEAEGS